MKKLIMTVAVLGTVLFSACEKNEQVVPVEKSLIKADKGILCRGCGDWDIIEPDATTTSLRVSSVDTTSTTPKTIRPRKKR